MPIREVRTLRATELRSETNDDGKQYLSGYAATYNTVSEDLGWGMRERIMPGAFNRALAEKQDVRHLINHDPNMVLGRTKSGTTELSSDAKGLKFKTLLPQTTYARDLAESVERGDVDECSFGFSIHDGGQRWIDEKDPNDPSFTRSMREVLDLDLFDVSTVTYPAYPQTNTELSSLRSLFPQGMPEEVRQHIAAHVKETYDYLTRSDDDAADDMNECACECAACQDGDCDECSNEECNDVNCRCGRCGTNGIPGDMPANTPGGMAKARSLSMVCDTAKKNVYAKCSCGWRSRTKSVEAASAAFDAHTCRAKDKPRTKRVDGEDLTADAFLIVGDKDDTSTWKLPVKFSTDEKTKRHLRNALARFNQLKGVSEADKAAAWKKLVAMAKANDIEVTEDSRSHLNPDQLFDLEGNPEAMLRMRRQRLLAIAMAL
jgi:hypothetical protein